MQPAGPSRRVCRPGPGGANPAGTSARHPLAGRARGAVVRPCPSPGPRHRGGTRPAGSPRTREIRRRRGVRATPPRCRRESQASDPPFRPPGRPLGPSSRPVAPPRLGPAVAAMSVDPDPAPADAGRNAPLLGSSRPPLRLEEGLIEVGWDAERGSTESVLPREAAHSTRPDDDGPEGHPGPEHEAESGSEAEVEEAIDDPYTAIQARSDRERDRERRREPDRSRTRPGDGRRGTRGDQGGVVAERLGGRPARVRPVQPPLLPVAPAPRVAVSRSGLAVGRVDRISRESGRFD